MAVVESTLEYLSPTNTTRHSVLGDSTSFTTRHLPSGVKLVAVRCLFIQVVEDTWTSGYSVPPSPLPSVTSSEGKVYHLRGMIKCFPGSRNVYPKADRHRPVCLRARAPKHAQCYRKQLKPLWESNFINGVHLEQ